jgi:hypothetical protein
MKRTLLVNSITFFFILLFVYTGIEKFMEIHTFREQLSSSPFFASIAGIMAWGLPIFEMLLAIVLFVPAWRLKGLYITLVLMTLFTGYVLWILLMDSHISCSCGGIIEDLSPKQHIVFNTSCVILSLVGILVTRRQQPTVRFRWATTSSVLVLFLLVGWVLSTAFSAPTTVKTGLEGRLLPSFNLLLPDSVTWLNTNDISIGKPIIMIGFDPFCRHCQEETADIIKNIKQFQNTRIYWVTPYKFNDMKQFYSAFRLSTHPNTTIGQDSANVFMKYIKATGVPYTAVFDSKKRLKTVFPGQVSADDLAKAAAE